MACIQFKNKIKKQEKHQNRHLGKQQFYRIYVRRVPNDSRIRSEQPKEKYVYHQQTTYKIEVVRSNNIS